jgi:hypothetical protein
MIIIMMLMETAKKKQQNRECVCGEVSKWEWKIPVWAIRSHQMSFMEKP